MGSPLTIGALALGLVFSQGTQVAHTLWLGFWQSNESVNLSQAAYQGIYAGVAVVFALAAFACNAACVASVIRASMRMCSLALERIMSSPTAFLDRTPVGLVGLQDVRGDAYNQAGRIVSRLTNGE
jgi:ABC-type multidrug transport system fused ATPase/permease subunit